MNKHPRSEKSLSYFLGFLILIGFHVIGFILIQVVYNILSPQTTSDYDRGYESLAVLAFSAFSFPLWQFVYALPLILWFRHRRYVGLMKGVMIGAALTVLAWGACYALIAG